MKRFAGSAGLGLTYFGSIRLQQLEQPGERSFFREGEVYVRVAGGIRGERGHVGAAVKGLRIRTELENQRGVVHARTLELEIAGAVIGSGVHRDGTYRRRAAPLYQEHGREE